MQFLKIVEANVWTPRVLRIILLSLYALAGSYHCKICEFYPEMLRSWLRQNGHYLQLQINLKNIFICRCKLFCVFFICPKYSQAHIIKLTSMWSFHTQNFCLQLLGSVRIWRHINISRLCSSCHPSSGIFGFSCYLFVFALNFFTCQTDEPYAIFRDLLCQSSWAAAPCHFSRQSLGR